MAFDPYAGVRTLFDPSKAPSHVVTDEDKARLQSYDSYENIYHTMPGAFKILQRGQDSAPIYLPSAKKCIEACNRFLAVDFGTLTEAASDEDKATVERLLFRLFLRQKFYTKFASQKRYGLIRGDHIWHVLGDDLLPEGDRISLVELDPRCYFPIFQDNNKDKLIGCHLVDIIIDPSDEKKTRQTARRQTYRLEEGGVTSELLFFEVGKWDDRNLEAKDIKMMHTGAEKPKVVLPDPITKLPIYKIQANRIPGFDFGFSEVMGMERVMGAVNQAVSDEELALAFSGLGIYFTTSGPPRDAAGQPTAWEIGPARVIEIPKDATMGRLSGVASVQPSLDHMKFMLGEMQGGMGISDVAAGRVDVQAAESGISLMLQMGPLLAHNAEREGAMIEAYDEMFHDLVTQWFVAFEDVPPTTTARVSSVTSDPMPRNRAADIQEIIDLHAAELISTEEARIRLVKLGYDISDTTADPIISELRIRRAAADPDDMKDRLDEELSDTGQSGQRSENPAGNGAVLLG